jgi:phenylalanyl-tRNA synthetase beta chain
MQFSERWLRTLIDPPLSTAELSHLLTMAGLEVESCDPVAGAFSGVVVGEVREVGRHPNADRLSLCKVDVGGESLLNIVCGAPNVSVGIKVPCAVIGARLSGEDPAKPFEIRAAKMRGVESQGMLCSARELGISDDHGGLLILDPHAAVGTNVRDLLALDDAKFTIKLTPNRADALSVLGVARDVAALTDSPLNHPDTSAVPAVSAVEFSFGISATEGCGRFTGRVIRNVNAAAATPDWMKERLERAGQRSISALVDVTNYVMLELGRPLHVYDLDKLSGRIDVRFGRKGESLKLLNEQVIELDDGLLCITDQSGPIGLAGIMGGESTKAELSTKNIFLESAFFFPEAIAGRARRLNFSSDASHRFERGVDFDNNVAGIERATRLILDICGGEPGPVRDVAANLPERKPVTMRVARARKVLGVDVPSDEMGDIFRRLNLTFQRHGEGEAESYVVTPPSWRFDIGIEEDLIEEVARIYGFERIPAVAPVAPAVMHVPLERKRSLHDLRDRMAAQGYLEVVNFSFVERAWEDDFAGNATPIQLLNPIASQHSVMRSTLFGSLIANVRYNLNRKLDRVRVFEVGRVFSRSLDVLAGDYTVAGLLQPVYVGGIAYGSDVPEQWGSQSRMVDFYDVKGDLENLLSPLKARFEKTSHPALHPGRSARILLDGAVIGAVGELHPRLQQKYELPMPPVLFEVNAQVLLDVGLPAYSEVSKFPPIVRDLAVLVRDDIPVDALLDRLRSASDGAVREISLFDVYRGKGVPQGEKSLAFRIVMQDTAKTLTDSEADIVMAKLTQALAVNFDARLRG